MAVQESDLPAAPGDAPFPLIAQPDRDSDLGCRERERDAPKRLVCPPVLVLLSSFLKASSLTCLQAPLPRGVCLPGSRTGWLGQLEPHGTVRHGP